MAGLKGPQGPLKAGLRRILLAYTAASSPPTASASITSTLPNTGTVGGAISFTYTSANVTMLYWAVLRNGTLMASPVAFAAVSGTQTYIPSVAASYQFAFYTSASSTIPIYTSLAISVTAAAAPMLVLDQPGAVSPGAPFAVSATLSNYTGQPALAISVDGAASIAMTSASPYSVAFTPSTGAPTGFTFTAQALSSGNHTVEVLDTTNGLSSTITVSVSAPQSGGTSTPGNLPAFRVQANAAMATSSPITLGHFFAKGDVPAGTWTKLIASTTGGQTAQVQVDQTNTWPSDGSLRFAALSFLSPIAFTTGQVASFQLGAGTGTLTGAALTQSQMLAAGDFSLAVAGGADFGGAMTISGGSAPVASSFSGVNNSTLTASGGGSNPLVLSQTYQESNAVASEVMALSGSAQTYTAIVQAGNFIGYAEGGLTLRNSGTGQQTSLAVFTPDGGNPQLQVNGFSNPTTNTSGFGTQLTGLSYARSPLFMRIAFDATNYTFLVSPTGAANSWTQLAQQSAASVFSPNQIGFYLSANAAGNAYSGPATLTVSDWEVTSGANLQGAAAASITTATVPFAISAQDVLTNFTQSTGIAGWGTNSPLGGWEMIRSGPICSEWRCWRYLKRTSDGASHAQVKAKLYVRAWSDGQGGIRGYQVLPGLFQENSYGPVSGATVGVTASPQAFRISSATLDQGATSFASYGAYATNPQRGWWGALTNGHRPWIGVNGAAEPNYMVAHDVPYAIGTRCVPPYDYQAVAQLSASLINMPSALAQTYTPNVSNLGPAINATGDDNSDQRYGYLNVDSAALFLNPLDLLREQTVLAFGWSWADWNFWICDERTGWPVNTGTDSSTCPSPANPTFEMYGNNPGQYGSPAWWSFGTSAYPGNYPQFQYGPNWDNSHTPSLWIMPLLRTGDAAFEEMALFQCSTSCAFTDQGGRNFTFNGSAYENVVLGFYQMEGAERAGANWLKQFGATDRMMRDANPMRGYVKRALSQNSAYAAQAPNLQNVGTGLGQFGVFWASLSDTGPNSGSPFPHLFMTSLLAFMLGIEARVGDYSGWQVLLNAMQPLFIGLYDAATGGSSFDFTVYDPQWSDGTTAYANWAAMRVADGLNDGPHAESAGFRYGSSGDGGLGTLSSIPRAAIYMAGWLDQPITDAVSVAQESYNRYKATYPGQPGVINYTTSSDSAGLCPQFAIAPPPGVS